MTDPYSTCGHCLVKEWCGRRNGTSPLPKDYDINPECGGYVMLEKAFELSEIPSEYRYANKNNFQFDSDNSQYRDYFMDTFDRIVELVDNGQNIAMVHPSKGTGKTHTVVTFALEYIFKTCMSTDRFDFETPLALYVKYGKWANDLRQVYQLNDEEYSAKVLRKIKKMKETPLLIIDDIGSGRLTPYVKDLTYDVIDYRKENELSTFVTTNIPISQLEQDDYLGDIITSRMLYNTFVYQLGGRDRRKEKTYFL